MMNAGVPGAVQIAAAVQSRQLLAREIVDDALSRAVRAQPQFHLFTTLTADAARQQAKKVDDRIRNGARLPLAGVPFAVKDLFDVIGTPTTCGSRAFADRLPGQTATVVRRLLDAGAVLLGKLNMHECAFGFTGENPTYGNCPNPWDTTRIAGGSSSGSAVAVALGICPFTIGSDSGGSIRLPAALCGLVGLKPTFGRVSRAGAAPLSWTMDHVGPLARTAEETALVLKIVAGHDRHDPSSSARKIPDYRTELARELRGLRIGIPRAWFFDSLQPEVSTAVTDALDRFTALGAQPVEITLPHLREALGAHRAIIFAEAASAFLPYLKDRPEKFDDPIRAMLLTGLFLPALDYLKAQRVRRTIRRAWSEVFEKVDCLVTPTAPAIATTFGQDSIELPAGATPTLYAFLNLTLPFNLSGHPALSLPCGFAHGLPIGLQVVGRPFAESLILRITHQYQQDTDWHRREPNVSA